MSRAISPIARMKETVSGAHGRPAVSRLGGLWFRHMAGPRFHAGAPHGRRMAGPGGTREERCRRALLYSPAVRSTARSANSATRPAPFARANSRMNAPVLAPGAVM